MTGRRDNAPRTPPLPSPIISSESHHEPPHPLLLDALVLLLLLALRVGVVRGHGLRCLLDLGCDGAVILLEVLGVLQDAVEVFLTTAKTKINIRVIKILEYLQVIPTLWFQVNSTGRFIGTTVR